MTRRPKIAAYDSERPAGPIAGPRRFVDVIVLAMIVLATFAVYSPSMNGGVVWDDNFNLTRPELQLLDGLYRIWFDPAATARYSQYYPLVHTAFWIEHKLWGDAVLGYHLVTVLWHSLTVLLVYLIVTKLRIQGALLAAAIFALHPVMVESVAWMTEQKNTLSAVFYLSAMLMYLGFDESRKRSRYFIALGLFALALLTKTVTVTLPVALLIILWWQRGALSWRRDLLPVGPFFLLSIAGGLMTVWVEHILIGAKGAEFELTTLDRILLAGRDIWFYLSKLLWPSNLMFVYPRWTIDPAQWWQWIFPIAAVGVTLGLLLNRKRWRGPLAGWLYYCGTLFPVLGFLNIYFFRYSFVADHFQYLATLGIIVPFAALVAKAIAGLAQSARYASIGLCVSLVGTLAILTYRQTPMYSDSITLYETTIARNPECWLAHNNLGLELADRGDPDAAMAHYRSALRIKPDYADAHSNIGNALNSSGRLPEAIEEFRIALALNTDEPAYHSNLAGTLTQLGRFQEAIDHCREALRLQPEYFDALHNLGTALLHAGQLPKALDAIRGAQSLRPDDPVVCNTLGAALLQAGEYAEAAQHFERALELRPNYAEARNNLAQLLVRTGRIPQAVEQFRQALALNDNFAGAHIGLALVLAGQGKFEESIGHFEKAIKLGADQPDVHNNLGDSYRKSGQMDRAIERYRAAVRLKPDYMLAYANLAQTLALVDRSNEAVAVSEKAIEVARSTGQDDALGQFEEWLKHYRTELQRAANTTGTQSSPPPN